MTVRYSMSALRKASQIARPFLLERRRIVNGCWEWTRTLTSTGYGHAVLRLLGRLHWKVHRLAWIAWRGRFIGPCVLHRCDNRKCFRPSHLKCGTPKDNTRDMVGAGRGNHQKKSHCPQGHQYAGENLYMWRGWRFCRKCNNAYTARRARRMQANPKARAALQAKQRAMYRRMRASGLARCWVCHKWTTHSGRLCRAEVEPTP